MNLFSGNIEVGGSMVRFVLKLPMFFYSLWVGIIRFLPHLSVRASRGSSPPLRVSSVATSPVLSPVISSPPYPLRIPENVMPSTEQSMLGNATPLLWGLDGIV